MSSSLILTVVASLVGLNHASTDSARIRPAQFGEWRVVCLSPVTVEGHGESHCNLTRTIWRLDDSGAEAQVFLSISSGFDETVIVTTSGRSAATCHTVNLREEVRRGYSVTSEPATEAVLAAFEERVSTVLRSHLRMLAVCTPMQRRVSDFPMQLLDTSRSDLRRAIDAIEDHWKWHRRRSNPVARERESDL